MKAVVLTITTVITPVLAAVGWWRASTGSRRQRAVVLFPVQIHHNSRVGNTRQRRVCSCPSDEGDWTTTTTRNSERKARRQTMCTSKNKLYLLWENSSLSSFTATSVNRRRSNWREIVAYRCNNRTTVVDCSLLSAILRRRDTTPKLVVIYYWIPLPLAGYLSVRCVRPEIAISL